MKHDIVAPTVGESITEVRILSWRKPSGSMVKVGETILEIESDKATVEVISETAGVLNIIEPEGATVNVGKLVAQVDDAAQATAAAPSAAAPKAASTNGSAATPSSSKSAAAELSPAVRKIASEGNIDTSKISGSGKDGRVTKGDLLDAPTSSPSAAKPAAPVSAPTPSKEGERRVPMSMLRQRIAQRLLEAQQNAAILTTFNEVDLKAVMDLRKKYKDPFKAKFGVGLGFMSFFTRASVLALKEYPLVNAFLEGQEIVYHDYYHVAVAVGTERGLVVPVLRDVDKMSFSQIEGGIIAMAGKARDGKLSIADMSGGTFTISNGGVYGSMLSTPILNPPQTGILGMHNIVERAVVIDGQIVVRPMMYLALSYDHRLIDGKEAVSFLVKIKELLEKPEDLGLEFVREL